MKPKLMTVAAAVVLTVASCSSETNSTSSTVAESNGFTDARFVAAAVGQIQSVSPDGSLLLTSDGTQICVQSVDDSNIDCVDWSQGVSEERTRLATTWSADSARVTFFDVFERGATFRAALWHLDVPSQTLSQLAAADGLLPLAIAESPTDGLLALVGSVDGEDGTYLFDDSLAPTRLSPISAHLAVWIPDGSGLVTSDRQRLGVIERTTGSFEELATPDPELGAPDLSDVSSDGRWILAAYSELVARRFFSDPNVSHFGVLDRETGRLSPLKEAGTADFVGPISAVFSPNGASVAYLFHDGVDLEDRLVLAVRDLESQEETVFDIPLANTFGATDDSVNLFFNPGLNPVWASAGRLVFPSGSRALVLDSC